MAFDGIMISSIVHELKGKIVDGRMSNIQQTDDNELFLTIKGRENVKLYLKDNPTIADEIESKIREYYGISKKN